MEKNLFAVIPWGALFVAAMLFFILRGNFGDLKKAR